MEPMELEELRTASRGRGRCRGWRPTRGRGLREAQTLGLRLWGAQTLLPANTVVQEGMNTVINFMTKFHSLASFSSAWPGHLNGCCKAKFKSAIYNLLSPVNFHVAWGDFCLGDQTYISDRNQVTLPIILQFLRTCIISQMHKSYHARIILWVS